jgi:CspA family cold shock protein
MEGIVKFYHESKGFGYIIEKETNDEYYIHVSGLINRIKDEDHVSFEVTEGKRGLQAIEVRIIKAS